MSTVMPGPAAAGRPRPDAAPDLDAGAPELRSVDVQRLNRKALAFLAGIVGLLLVAAFWLLGSVRDAGRPAGPGIEERVVIPEAPADVPLPPLPPVVPPEPVLALPLAMAPAAGPPRPAARAGTSVPGLLERRMQSAGALATGTGPASVEAYAARMDAIGAEGDAGAQDDRPARGAAARPLRRPDTLMVRGTLIRCVLETRIVTGIPGHTSCIVTEPVYSVNGRRLLLPKGAKVLGSYGADAAARSRVAVVWDRIVTPDGLDIDIGSPGVDPLGGAGHPGHYDAHWAQRIGSALLISMVGDGFKYAGAKHGPQQVGIASGTVVQSPYESDTARTMQRMAHRVLEQGMGRAPTVTVNQGEIVSVHVVQDVDFSGVLP